MQSPALTGGELNLEIKAGSSIETADLAILRFVLLGVQIDQGLRRNGQGAHLICAPKESALHQLTRVCSFDPRVMRRRSSSFTAWTRSSYIDFQIGMRSISPT